jgi:hypothetical protein
MRTTVDLPDHLLQIVKSLALHTGRTFSQTVEDLMERGLNAPARTAEPKPHYRVHPQTGLPVTSAPRPITPDDVARLEDEI